MAKEGKERKNKERKMRRRSYPMRDCSRHLRCQERGGEMRNEEDGRGTDPGLSGTMGAGGSGKKIRIPSSLGRAGLPRACS
jgi:hypothetical protein